MIRSLALGCVDSNSLIFHLAIKAANIILAQAKNV